MTLTLCCESVPRFREVSCTSVEPHGETHTDVSHTCSSCDYTFADCEEMTHEVPVVCDYCLELTDDAERTQDGQGDLWRCQFCKIKQDPERTDD